MLALALQWVLSAVSVVVVSKVLPGFRLKHFGTALIVAAIYGLLHVLLYTLLKILFFLPMVLTFGLFALVINAFLLFLTDKLLDDFDIDTLWATLVGAILLTLINGLWRWLLFST
jgi:putative membrane protein